MSDVLDIETLDGPTRAALERLILTLADSKRLMGIRYSDWLLGSPSIETGVAASSMAQDEWGHARLLYSMLKDLGKDPTAFEHDRASEAYGSVSVLDEEMPDWAALVAAMTLADGAISTLLASFAAGTFETARSRVPKMLAEEEFHSSLGSAWFRRLSQGEGEARRLLLGATESMLPTLLAWVGADDEAAQRMVSLGVIAPAAERLSAYRDSVRELTALVGMDVDSIEPDTRWDPARGRAPGWPAEESVERARGDRNRALFVE